MKRVVEILSETRLFNGLPDAHLLEMADIVVEKYFQKGEIIFSEGDEGNGFYIVADGNVKIFKVSPDGKEHILHIFGAGEPFGEVPVFSGKPFPANAESMDASYMLFLPRGRFVSLITSNPSLSLNMLTVLAQRLRQFTIQIENLSLKEVPGRLASYLIAVSVELDDADVFDLKIPKKQLASLLGTIPETLSRVFSRMVNDRLIEIHDKTIRIVDRDRLELLAITGK